MAFRIHRCAAVVLLSCGISLAQTTAPTTAATLPGRHITSQPAGIMLNFRNVPVDTVLDELAAAAGFVVVKEVKPQGRVTLVSAQPLPAADVVPLLNTVLKNTGTGYTAIPTLKIVALNPAATTAPSEAENIANDPYLTIEQKLKLRRAQELKGK